MNKQKGVVILIGDLSSGGAQKVASSIANYWADQNKPVTVVTMKPESDDFFSLSNHAARHVIGEISQSRNLFSALAANYKRIIKIRRTIVESKQDTVISFVASTNILAIIAAFGLPVRVIISERNDPARQSHGRMWDLLRRLLYRYASIVTANSMQAVESLQEYVPEHKLAYVPNPIHLPSIIESKTCTKTVLHVGKLIEQKAHDIILKSWEIVNQKHPDWKIDFVGDGPLMHNMKKNSDSLSCRQTIRWHGWCHKVNEFYQCASIFILPSRFEGTPNALMEAMSYGMPCIISDQTGGGMDLIHHEKSGLIVSADHIEELAEAVIRLIEDEDLRGKLGAAAQERIQSHEISNVIKIWDDIVELN